MKNLAEPPQTGFVTPAVVHSKVNIVYKVRFLRKLLLKRDTILSTDFNITNVMFHQSHSAKLRQRIRNDHKSKSQVMKSGTRSMGMGPFCPERFLPGEIHVTFPTVARIT